MAEVITVTALNRYVKALLDGNEVLFDLALRGEISNYVCNARSGHCYFSLKDTQCSVKAVMFRSDARRLGFAPENGMRVIVRCRVTLYERDGAFQVYVSDMFPDGIGAAQMAFEQLKAKLDAEGLFAQEHKVPLPKSPRCIGVITSKTGAALQDIINVCSRRWPVGRLLLYPVSVQGFEAAGEIAGAIASLDKSRRADVMIVARGGGSREDLWVFNAEVIARAAYACKTPLISAIGHEIDFTILDFVADLRAPTPSAAAELAVPDLGDVSHKIYTLKENIQFSMQNRLQVCYNEINLHSTEAYARVVDQNLTRAKAKLAECSQEIPLAAALSLRRRETLLRHTAALGRSLSPYETLHRGYAMLCDAGGSVITADSLAPGQELTLFGAQKKAHCTVNTVEERTHENSEIV